MQFNFVVWGQFIRSFVASIFNYSVFRPLIFRVEDLCFSQNICIPIPQEGNAQGASTSFVNTIIEYASVVGIFVALLLIVLGAYKIIMSGGDQNQIRDGKEQIQNALMGLLVVLLCSAIVVIVFNGLGVT